MKGILIIHHKQGNHFRCACENRNCEYDKTDNVETWEEAKEKGWSFEPASLIGSNKANSINPDLMFSNSVKAEIYCPLCSN